MHVHSDISLPEELSMIGILGSLFNCKLLDHDLLLKGKDELWKCRGF